MSKNFRLFVFSLLFVILVIGGCGNDNQSSSGNAENSSDETEHTIKVANNFGNDHPHNIALREEFKAIIEEESNGDLTVEVYENNQLGGEQEAFDGVRSGQIEMAVAGTVVSGDPEKINVGNWPFLFNDLDHAKKAFTGEIGDEIGEDLEEETGVKVLGWNANGFRAFSSHEPITSMEDFEGMRLRMPDLSDYIKIGELLGSNVISLPFSEVFTALEQGVADGQDNPISTLKNNGFYEVQNYVLESNHVFSPNVYVFNRDLWNELSDNQKEIVEKAAKASSERQWELYRQSVEDDKEFLQEEGVEFITPDEEFRENMSSAMDTFYNDVYEEYSWAEELVNKIKEMD